MKNYVYFDHAATTRCCPESMQALQRYSCEEFANPSSSHALGQKAARAIREARLFFADTFRVEPDQVIFTGSGTESDNLAIYGIAVERLARKEPVRILVSAIEHPAVKKTALSLSALGADVHLIPVDERAQINEAKFLELLTPQTTLVSVQHANNIVGSELPVERLAALAKERCPGVVFHSDCVQSFGKIRTLTAPSSVDLVSISGHKIEGPKGIGALIVLNKALLKNGMRPQIWGGGQECGMRSGTQNPGAICGFFEAAKRRLSRQSEFTAKITSLQARLRSELAARGLSTVQWNSPSDAVPHVVSLSIPGYPSGPLTKLLEERGFIVSTGSACSSQKPEPDPVLTAMGLPSAIQTSAIRLSFSDSNELSEVDAFVGVLAESLELMNKLLGIKPKKSSAASA